MTELLSVLPEKVEFSPLHKWTVVLPKHFANVIKCSSDTAYIYMMKQLCVIVCLSAWPSGYGRAPPDFLHFESGRPGFDSRGGQGQPNCPSLTVGTLVAMSRQMGDRCWILRDVNRAGSRCAACGLCSQLRKPPQVSFRSVRFAYRLQTVTKTLHWHLHSHIQIVQSLVTRLNVKTTPVACHILVKFKYY